MSLKDFLAKKKSHKGFKCDLDPDIVGLDKAIIEQDYTEGMQIAESCGIPEMDTHFKLMRGNQNCFTGFPNSGKTQLTLFIQIVKSMVDGWKWVLWSPEMRKANFVDNKVKVHYNRLAYEIMASLSGKTPYEIVHKETGVPLMTLEERMHWVDWIDKHFIFLEPNNKKIDDVYDILNRVYENHGCDGFLIDPYKNIEVDGNVRDDIHLHRAFAKFQDLAVRTNSVMNWIAHPKSGVPRTFNANGIMTPTVCNVNHLAGGAAWDNSMDGIYTIHSPNCLTDTNDPYREFINLKERDQLLVAKKGKVENIRFDISSRRYYFDGVCPIGNKKENPFPETNSLQLWDV